MKFLLTAWISQVELYSLSAHIFFYISNISYTLGRLSHSWHNIWVRLQQVHFLPLFGFREASPAPTEPTDGWCQPMMPGGPGIMPWHHRLLVLSDCLRLFDDARSHFKKKKEKLEYSLFFSWNGTWHHRKVPNSRLKPRADDARRWCQGRLASSAGIIPACPADPGPGSAPDGTGALKSFTFFFACWSE